MTDTEDPISPIGDNDWEAISALFAEVLDDGADEIALVEALRAEGEIEIALLAGDPAEPSGFAIASRMLRPEGTLGLGPVAVLDEARRRGLGGQLIHALIAEAKAKGWTAIFVFGEPNFYERFGFSVRDAARFTSPWPPEFMMALELEEGALARAEPHLAFATAFAAMS